MSYLIKPKNYNPLLDLKQTELGIKQIKEFFQLNLSSELRLRRTCAALHLHIFYGGRKVGHIYPEQIMAFSIVHRYAVYRDVDTCTVGSAHAKSRVADTCSCIRCGQCRRSHA